MTGYVTRRGDEMTKMRMMGFWSGRLFVGTRTNEGNIHVEFVIIDEKGSVRDAIELDDWNELVDFIQEQVNQHEEGK